MCSDKVSEKVKMSKYKAMECKESILEPDDSRFVLFPIKYKEVSLLKFKYNYDVSLI